MLTIPPAVIAGAAKLAKDGVTVLVIPGLKKYLGTDHGSKVKDGAYKGSSIEMLGIHAYIADQKANQIVPLTFESVESCEYIEEKFRIKRMKTYYYYKIYFKDGRSSTIRVSEKYRDAILSYT